MTSHNMSQDGTAIVYVHVSNESDWGNFSDSPCNGQVNFLGRLLLVVEGACEGFGPRVEGLEAPLFIYQKYIQLFNLTWVSWLEVGWFHSASCSGPGL